MNVLFLFLYAGFCCALSPVRFVPQEGSVPLWLGGNYTPHGAVLNRFEGRWTISFLWALVLVGATITGRIFALPGLTGIVVGFVLLLWILGLVALGHRLKFYEEPPLQDRDESGVPSFRRFRILIREPGASHAIQIPALGPLCVNPEVSSAIRDTPYTFLKEINRDGLLAALEVAPELLYQPVQADITEQTDEHIATLQQEVHSHADKALASQADRQRAQERVTLLEERIALLEKSEKQARDDLERVRTRSRTAMVSKPIEQMTDRELEDHYRSLMGETRKVNLLKQSRAGGAIRQTSLPIINP